MSKRKQNKFSDLQRYLTIFIIFLLVSFIIAQFVVLDLAGIHGPKITELRAEQEQIKLDNDLKRAKINELKVSADIQSFAKDNLNYVQKSVNTIDVSNSQEDLVAASR